MSKKYFLFRSVLPLWLADLVNVLKKRLLQKAILPFVLVAFSILRILGIGLETTKLLNIQPFLEEANGHQVDDASFRSVVKQHRNNYSYPFTVGACLLTRDDTMILPEWLAYHYTVLPLRHLIVAVDPLSLTSPAYEFDAFWKHTDMTIDMWTGNSYILDLKAFISFDSQRHRTSLRPDIIDFYLERQYSFYTKCLQTYKEEYPEIQWVILIDSDEYFTYNPLLPIEVTQQRRSGEPVPSSTDWTVVNATRFRQTLPKKIGRQNETIAHWISAHSDDLTPSINQTLCMAYPRLFFSALQEQSHGEEQEIISGPQPLSSRVFRQPLHTLKFPGHWPRVKRAPVKSMVNLHLYDGVGKVSNAHRPFKWNCTGNVFDNVLDHRPFRVHHYTSDLETFLLRASQNEDTWRKRNNFAIEGTDDSMTEWFSWFVELVGEAAARELIVDTVERARLEWLDIKRRVEIYNETIAPIFEWDQPAIAVRAAEASITF